MGKTICFTGPRPKKLWGYSQPAYVQLVNKLTELIIECVNKGFDTFISGGAQGFDQLAFWAVHNAKNTCPKIKNIVYVPFKGQELQWLSTGLFSQAEYRLMLEKADATVYLASVDTNNKSEVCKALYNRNHSMCDNADTVIGLYDTMSFKTDQHSGTAECLRYADDSNLPIILMNKTTFETTYLPGDSTKPNLFRGK